MQVGTMYQDGMKRIGYLAAAEADIHFFGHQRGGFTVPAEGDVFQNDVGW